MGVAVSRGAEMRGMDFINLKQNLATMSSGDLLELSKQLPYERTHHYSVNTFHETLAVSNKTELLLYGGQVDDTVCIPQPQLHI
jgi:hypothetical protein